MPTNAHRAKAIFWQAIEEHSPDSWSAFLDEACADDAELRHDVLGLLQAHKEKDSLLDRTESVAKSRPLAQRGQMIGPYKVREEIGEGGMGSVYVAQQAKPLRRKVALKVIKPGMDTREVLGRFEAERNALALMNHPNIAKVLDAGTTEEGRPYFVMELVSGIPITEYCDQHKMTIQERLRLFVLVCGAIQHAHQKGIIHRDIKPSNVLVTELDGHPVPKVIDFGVAKALNQTLTEHSIYTAFRTVVGTPLYMSPEQASLSAVDVDTRSDVYSLGVLLYELLTGTTPFDQNELRQAAHDEVLRVVREREPPRPSNRISTLGETATHISQRRRTQPDQLGRLVKGDLDWIVMKALEKERGRRYKTADSLAADVDRHLKDVPVEARPPSAAYRLSRFYRRNRAGVVTATIASCSILMTICVITLAMLKAQRLANEYQDVVFEQALFSLMAGDANPDRHIQKAIRIGVPSHRIELLSGLAALYTGNPDTAIEHLKSALAYEPNSVPGNAMLALAHYYAGDLMKGIHQREKAAALIPSQSRDYLFLAHIGLSLDPGAIEHVNRFLNNQPSPLGLAVRADASAWRAIDGQPELLPQALEDIRAARLLLGPTAYVLQTELSVCLQAIKLARKRGLDDTALLNRAKKAESTLAERFPNYVWGNAQRAFFWDYLGDLARSERAWMASRHWQTNPWCQHAVATTKYRRGALDDARQQVYEMDSHHYQVFTASVLVDTDEGRDFAQALYGQAVELADDRYEYREPYVLAVPLLLGKRAMARAEARRWLATFEFASRDETSWIHFNETCIRFLAGEFTEEQFIKYFENSPARLVFVHYYIGVDRLSQGDKAGAKVSFTRSFHNHSHTAAWWADGCLQRMRKSSDWPEWIPTANVDREESRATPLNSVTK